MLKKKHLCTFEERIRELERWNGILQEQVENVPMLQAQLIEVEQRV